MQWFAIAFIVIGVFLLLLIPLLIMKVRTDPISVLRPQWHHTTSKGFAIAVGILVIIAALLGGLGAIIFGALIIINN